jgi:hypothetical protein
MTAAPARDFGPKPELAWLSVDVLYVDPAYQRTMESKRSISLIERMLKAFRWSAFGVLKVAPTKSEGIANRYALMDGQHRWTVAKRLGIKEVPCEIIQADAVSAQAQAFLDANLNRVIVNAYALHHAQMVAGDRDAGQVAQACAEAGVEIPRYPIPHNILKPNQTLAIGAIRSAIASSNTRVAANALRVIRQAFPESGALRAHFITGIHAALKDGATVDGLVAKLQATTLKAFERTTHDWALDNGIPKWKAVKEVLGGAMPAANSVEIRRDLTKSAEAPPQKAPPAPKKVTLPTGNGAAPKRAPASADPIEIERHIREKGATKCPTAYVAATQGGKADFKAKIERPETATEMHARQKREHSAIMRSRA